MPKENKLTLPLRSILPVTALISLGLGAAPAQAETNEPVDPAAASTAARNSHPLPTTPYSRDLVSLSLQQVIDAKLDTGLYHGSPKVLADPEGYAADFYETLASRKRYLDEQRDRWEIEPISQPAPPPCGQPQPTRYDAESCRYVNALFAELEARDPEVARQNREQVRRGRDVWFKGTFGNQDLYNHYLATLFGGTPDYSSWLDTRNRDQRFKKFGLMNDPGCRPGSEQTYWLDECDDPHSSGVLGVRKYYADASDGFDPYTSPYQQGEIAAQKRFVVGFACAICHVAFDPTNPPQDPANPQWQNLMGGIGNQYLRHGSLFVQNLPKDYFLRVVLDSARPGTSDTSLVGNDYIHNPGAMNAIMNTHNRPVFEERVTDPISAAIKKVRTRHVLKGGEDSVGERLALIRVYVNVGLCAEECWTDKFPTLGAMLFDTKQRPFDIKACSEKCESWNYADAKMDDLLAYLVSVGPTYLDKAVDIDGRAGSDFIDASLVPQGRKLFIENCARCHSTREIPEFVDRNDPATMARLFDGHIFGGFHAWQRELGLDQLDDEQRQKLLAVVIDPASGKPNQQLKLQQDWLGNDELLPYTEIGTNRCRAIQTNHLQGHLWEQFSSLDYKDRSSPGTSERIVNPLLPWVGGSNPFGMQQDYEGGQGYLRNISLLSVWSSAPLLHNNALGPYPLQPDGTPDYTVKGRVGAFEAAMQELLTSDNLDDSPHRQPLITAAASDIDVPAREDGGGLLSLTLEQGDPVGYMASVDPHAPVFSNCTDYVENKGHQFGIDLSAAQKAALIEFLKTL